jgi:hypothetical protein
MQGMFKMSSWVHIFEYIIPIADARESLMATENKKLQVSSPRLPYLDASVSKLVDKEPSHQENKETLTKAYIALKYLKY